METISPRKKFAITSCTPPYEPAQRTKPYFEIIRKYDSNAMYGHSQSHRLYITNKAMDEVFNHIRWGERTERNVVEQGGILLGHVFRDENKKLTYGIVEAAIAGSLAKGSSSYLELTHETWKQMLESVDEILNQNPQKNLQVIGWYHTHPNNLDTYMSGTDKSTQSRLFSHDWQFAIVMNPHKKIWRAFYGVNASECRGFVFEGLQDSESDYFPEKLPADDVERLKQDSNEELGQKTKVFRGYTNLARLKKYPLKLRHSFKTHFGRWRKDKPHSGNQAQLPPNQDRRLPNVSINENKIDFFLWLYGFLLLGILLLQIAIFCLLLFSSDKK